MPYGIYLVEFNNLLEVKKTEEHIKEVEVRKEIKEETTTVTQSVLQDTLPFIIKVEEDVVQETGPYITAIQE